MKKTRVSRRAFLETAAAATIAAQMKFAGAQGTAKAHAPEAWPENGTLIPDEGWRLWVDEKAEWKQDAIFLPKDVTRDANGAVLGAGQPLPVNAPTGGWGVLGDAAGIGVTLPGTVEQHFWGKYRSGGGRQAAKLHAGRVSLCGGRSRAAEWRVLRRVVVVAGD